MESKQELCRLSPEDELMMAGASMEVRRALTRSENNSTGSLASTPEKESSFLKEKQLGKVDMPKPFKL